CTGPYVGPTSCRDNAARGGPLSSRLHRVGPCGSRCELGQGGRKVVTLMPLRGCRISPPTAKPQGNAMKSVRMLAAGAVALFALPALTAPVRACDDRFIKKCEAESEAAFRAETEAATTPPPRRTRHVR